MRKPFERRYIAIIVVVLVLITVALWLYTLRDESPSPMASPDQVAPEREPAADTTAAVVTSPTKPVTDQATGQLTRSSQLAAAAEAQNVPVHFWGKVVGQDGAPLPGVKVQARIRHWELSGLTGINSQFIPQTAASGTDGRFEFTGSTGDVLTVESLEKDGYEPDSSALRSFGYNVSTNISPDSNNPVVLRMWKVGSKAELISGEKFFAIIPDGRVYTIDLFKGTKLESDEADGDFRLWVKRPSGVKRGQRYDWSCGIQPINGDLLEEPDLYSSMSIAPPDGYFKRWEFSAQASERTWGERLRKRFYVRIRDRQVHGWIHVDIFARYGDEGDGTFGIKYAVNPSGSPNLR